MAYTSYGLYASGRHYGTGNAYGAYDYAYHSGTSGTTYGTYSVAYGSDTGTAYGVYGYAANGATNYAGYFRGDVMITDTSLNDAVAIKPDGYGSSGSISLYDYSGDETVAIKAAETTSTGAEINLRKADGTLTINLDADFNGDGRIQTDELVITGGSDLSEHFDIDGPKGTVKPGMLVSIDPKRPGKLLVSKAAYDNKVAGIISGAGGIKPGMMMGQKNSPANGAYPVALSGRVYCWADASKGAIQPGDLMTTSSTPGHAMRVSDHSRALGSIIGKAMTSLDKGKGLVLVLVSLQ
jgi:hypothetical protein